MRKLATPLALSFVALFQAYGTTSERPDFDHPWRDGLYSTVTAAFCCKDVEPKSSAWIKLKVKGMKKPYKVRAALQTTAAPLVVLLNGTFGSAKSDFTTVVVVAGRTRISCPEFRFHLASDDDQGLAARRCRMSRG